MKQLTGTEKQIKWAEEIRTKFIEEVATATEETCKAELKESGYPEEFDHDFFKKMVKIVLGQASAKWWIYHRENLSLYDINMFAEGSDEKSFKELLNLY